MESMKEGDVVEQIDGGPHMIVKKAKKERTQCVWFDPEKNKMQSSWFENDMLKVVRIEQ